MGVGSGIHSQSVLEWNAAQWALKGGEVHLRVVAEVPPLVVKEVDHKPLMVSEGSAGCLRAQMDHRAPDELAREA